MMTYLLVNTVFIGLVIIALRIAIKRPSRGGLVTLLALLLLTAVFDSLIVGLDIVGYDSDKILGVYIGRAPIEDFFYAILAVILVPALWNKLGKSSVRKN